MMKRVLNKFRFVGVDMKEYCLDELFDLQMGKTPSRKNAEYWNKGNNDWISIGIFQASINM